MREREGETHSHRHTQSVPSSQFLGKGMIYSARVVQKRLEAELKLQYKTKEEKKQKTLSYISTVVWIQLLCIVQMGN